MTMDSAGLLETTETRGVERPVASGEECRWKPSPREGLFGAKAGTLWTTRTGEEVSGDLNGGTEPVRMPGGREPLRSLGVNGDCPLTITGLAIDVADSGGRE
ncbi:hypothetical protein VM1G_08518 [Cytospora mali]|uniref:Uncharacterized protein n=1 Tax=Cytospora mali TaxID=578113 RepID=A0A194W8W4_CYTMA|nr:hypothetical protein VM1G_08518 [Valsa mali]